MEDFEVELKLEFLEESTDLLENVEEAFLELSPEIYDNELLNEIFRLAHNLKGTAKAVGFDQLADLTHVAENLILKLKEKLIPISEESVSALLEFKDQVADMVEGLKADLDASFEIDDLVKKIEKVTNSEEKGNEPSQIIEPLFPEEHKEFETPVGSESEVVETKAEVSTTEQANEPEVNQAALDSLAELGMALDEMNSDESKAARSEPEVNQAALDSLKELGIEMDASAQPAEQPKTPEVKKPAAKKEKAKPIVKPKAEVEETIRVSINRIDKINNLIGELVILQTVISQRRYEFIQDELSNKSIGSMNKLFKEAQELSMSLRMLPLKTTFQKMNRIVRDTSKALDKKVALNIIGENTEVDKTVLEKIGDPLVHIIRNAVDHGIEDATERAEAGKSDTAQVELMAFHEGNNLVIQITDDGKGINTEVLKQKAIDKGILRPGNDLSEQEALNLIFHPGFSTKEQVTQVSGRGVGMDVVKTNIEYLGGDIKLQSKLGVGTSFKISLPLTLAIIEGVVINVAHEKFVLPLTQINEMVRVDYNEVDAFSGIADLFKLRGEVMPLFHLNQKLNKKKSEGEYFTVVIVRGLGIPFGVAIDNVVNQQQIVIKNLGEDLKNAKGIMGSAIMSDGMPALILDLFELFRSDMVKNRKHLSLQQSA